MGRIAAQRPAFIAQLDKAGVDPAPDASPAAFAEFLGKEIALWHEAVKTAGVTLPGVALSGRAH